jgi:hypothetical protein
MSAYWKDPEWEIELPDVSNWFPRDPRRTIAWVLCVLLAIWLIYNAL